MAAESRGTEFTSCSVHVTLKLKLKVLAAIRAIGFVRLEVGGGRAVSFRKLVLFGYNNSSRPTCIISITLLGSTHRIKALLLSEFH